ncbi:MAG: lipopolysaccharide biosynthesis protein [Acetobacteraceae bacterium]|nr:lipopolysaccharide biosynthesis protein [Acetobacteraceae bacterium]
MQLSAIFSGTLWVVAARWGIRAIGMVSTVVLARLLTPADFGVVALAMLVVGLIEIFNETGLIIYIIRHPDPQRSHFDTVFTLQLIIGAVLCAAIFLAAPFGAAFFRTPAIEPVIQVLSLRSLMWGMENPGIIWFRRNMVFSKDFQYMVVNKLVAFVVTLAAAVVLRDYRALVIGILAGGVVALVQSYRMHPYRPRLSLAEVRQAWSFSFWMLLVHMLEFANTRIDEIIIGRVRSTTEMGYYHVGSDIAATPVQEVISPMTRVWVPAFARLARDPVALEATYRWVISAVGMLALSVGVGLALVADDFAVLVLGPQWLPAVPVIRILALAAAMAAMTIPLGSVLGATGDPRVVLSLAVVRTVLLVATMVPAALWYGLAEVALGRAVATGVALMVSFTVFEVVAGLRLFTLARGLVRPALAAVAMAGVVLAVQAMLPAWPLLRLAASVAAGAGSYVGVLLGLWLLAGRPAGVERDVVGWLERKKKGVLF